MAAFRSWCTIVGPRRVDRSTRRSNTRPPDLVWRSCNKARFGTCRGCFPTGCVSATAHRIPINPGHCILCGSYKICNSRISAIRLPFDTSDAWPTPITLCNAQHGLIDLPFCNWLTFVLRSTHSLQLRVGLFRFCFTLICSPSSGSPCLSGLSRLTTKGRRSSRWPVVLGDDADGDASRSGKPPLTEFAAW